jgi:hypothetical protein
MMERKIEHLSQARTTPFGYSDSENELGHTGDSQMANDFLDVTLHHEYLSNESVRAIVNQLREKVVVQKIWKPIVRSEDFISCFECVPEKPASSYSGRSVPHYKACTQIEEEGIGELLVAVYAKMMMVPLDAGLCPERWMKAVYVMFEKVPGVIQTNTLRIIHILEADLNQVLRSAFAKNINQLAQDKDIIISEHQYGRSHRTCISSILEKLLIIQILIQKRKNWIFFISTQRDARTVS